MSIIRCARSKVALAGYSHPVASMKPPPAAMASIWLRHCSSHSSSVPMTALAGVTAPMSATLSPYLALHAA